MIPRHHLDRDMILLVQEMVLHLALTEHRSAEEEVVLGEVSEEEWEVLEGLAATLSEFWDLCIMPFLLLYSFSLFYHILTAVDTQKAHLYQKRPAHVVPSPVVRRSPMPNQTL